MTENREPSARIHGIWSLLFASSGYVTLLGDESMLVICAMGWFMVWQTGCEKRGGFMWSADLKDRPYLLHSALMLCIAGMLLGAALDISKSFGVGLAGLCLVMVGLSVDLICYPTKARYEQRLHSVSDQEVSERESARSGLRIRLSRLRQHSLLTWITALSALIVFIAEFKDVRDQIGEWWLLAGRKLKESTAESSPLCTRDVSRP